MNNYAQHQKKVDSMRLAICQKFGRSIRTFPRHVGLFYRKNGSPIKINRSGMCDTWGILVCRKAPFGDMKIPVHLEIETKTGSGQLSKAQREWRDFCHTVGVWHFVHRDNEKLIDEIKAKAVKCNLRILPNAFFDKFKGAN